MLSNTIKKSFRVTFAKDVSNSLRLPTVTVSRPISADALSYKGRAPYQNGSPKQKEVVDVVVAGARELGFDEKGAAHAEVAGCVADQFFFHFSIPITSRLQRLPLPHTRWY